MKRIALGLLITVVFALSSDSRGLCASKAGGLKRSRNYGALPAQVVASHPLPKGYHEGIFCDGEHILVCNGPKGNIWVFDASSGSITSEITPSAGFTESVIRGPDGGIFVTDWNEKKLYKARIDDNRIAPVGPEVSFAPSHPAGVIWNGSKFFVITWLRGALGTRFYLLEVDEKLNIVRRAPINGIQEPAHIAWDGRHLWISSWHERAVYKVDIDKYEIAGFFSSPVSRTTGIAFDGKNFWLTGTFSDLYKIKVGDIGKESIMGIELISGAFKNGDMIPKKYTCDGDDVSPHLSWSGVPVGAKSIALISDDPDAPMGTWVHWVIFNIPHTEPGLPEDISADRKVLDNGSKQGINDSRRIGYGGPCPPSGTHRYFFKIYALDTMLDLEPGITKKTLLENMKGHILGQGELMGKYKRQQ